MINRRDLERAIAECERGEQDYASCARLATLYEVHDHLYGSAQPEAEETVVQAHGDSDFMHAIQGAQAERVWETMDELMSTLKLINPRLYRGVMRRIAG